MRRNASTESREKTIRLAVKKELLPWFAKNARDLPWRKNRTAYRVWVSEIMLQQTRVDTVIDYYRRWMKKFPSWRALARAPQSDVLKAWEGLGYYTRARNLYAAAKIITDEYNGNLSKPWKKSFQTLGKAQLPHLRKCGRFSKSGGGVPRSLRLCEESPVQPLDLRYPESAFRISEKKRSAGACQKFLQKLPGVGAYTAAAIASLAFNEDAAVVDGNVIRVLSRLFAYGGDGKSTVGKKKIQAWADELLVKGCAGEFNESMMELGALVCLPKKPKCSECPMQKVCTAFEKGSVGKYPKLKKKKKVPHIVVGAAVTINRKGEVLIAQRKQNDMLGGLWEFPGGKLEPDETIEECIARELKEELGINIAVGDFFMTVKHAYSHFTMTLHVHRAKIISGRPRILDCADYKWVKISALRDFAYSKADLYVVAKLQK